MKARELASASNPRVKLARRLHERKGREESGLFLVEGPHVLEVALEHGAELREVFCTAGFLESHAGLAGRLESSEWPVWRVSEEVLRRLAATEEPQGVVAMAEMLKGEEGGWGLGVGGRGAEEGRPPLILALEGVADPGNVGNAIRAAHAAGASLVALGPGCCDRFNPKAVRASAGSLFAVATLAADDLAGLLARLRAQGARVLAAVPGGDQEGLGVGGRGPGVEGIREEEEGRGGTRKDECRMPNGEGREAGSQLAAGVPRPASQGPGLRVCWEVDMTGPTVLVVGSEAHGLSAAALAEATDLAAIPMPGGAESLNAGAAAAVLLYEAVRQRKSRPSE